MFAGLAGFPRGRVTGASRASSFLGGMLRIVRYKCRNCGHEGKVEVLSEDEMRDPRIPKRPVTCPKCRSTEVDVG